MIASADRGRACLTTIEKVVPAVPYSRPRGFERRCHFSDLRTVPRGAARVRHVYGRDHATGLQSERPVSRTRRFTDRRRSPRGTLSRGHMRVWRSGTVKEGVKRMAAQKAPKRGVQVREDLSSAQRDELLRTLNARFERNMNRHKGLEWVKVQARLEANLEKLWSVNEMERTGGEPDVVGHDERTGEYAFYDCSPESPKGRRSICYDREALEARKEHKPKDSAIDMAAAWALRF